MAWLGFGGDPHRPTILSVAFWANVLLILAFQFVPDVPKLVGTPVTVAVVLAMALLWLILPWDPAVPLPRKLAAPAFLLAAIALTVLAGDVSMPLLLIVVAHGVFLFGLGWGVAYGAVPLAVIFVLTLVLSERDVWHAVWNTVALAVIATVAIGAAEATLVARRRRAETERLLAELEEAHAGLRHYAERVRELSVADERARMAREMHDSVGHYLTVIKVGLENAERFRDRRPEAAWNEVAETKELTGEALAEVRRWVRALKPLALDGRAGPEAMAALVRSFEGTGIDVRFQIEGPRRDLPEEVELVLYRTLQEGLTNALRHAGAGCVIATLALGDGQVRLAVSGDGGGAPDGALDRGFGLSALTERVTAAGGTLCAGNCTGGGFELRVDLPAGRDD